MAYRDRQPIRTNQYDDPLVTCDNRRQWNRSITSCRTSHFRKRNCRQRNA